MKIETQLLEDHQAKLTVEVDPELMQNMKRRAARKIARRVKIPGFRPGKAPYQVVVRQLGEGVIVEEALEMLVDEIYPQVIDEAEITPYGPGSLENVSSLDPPVLEFMVPLEAEVTLGNYLEMRQAYEPEEITEKDVDDVFENLRERQAIIEPVERPAEEGDLVTIRLRAERNQVEGDQDPVLLAERPLPVIIRPSDEGDGDGRDDEWPFPGFSRHLLGLSADDEKAVEHTFSEDTETQAFSGEEVVFHLVIENVKARNLPDLDDDFAGSLGEYENLETLRDDVRSNLETQNQQAYDQTYDEEIMEAAIEQTSYKYPPQMLEQEIKDVIRDLERRLEQQNLDLDLYLKTRSLDMDGLREEVKPTAEDRIKRALFLFELAQVEKIQIEPDELQAEATSTVDFLSKTLPKQEARKLSDKNVYNNLVGNIMADMLSRRAMDRFRDICKGLVEEDVEEQDSQPQEADTPEETVQEVDVTDQASEQDVEVVAAVDQAATTATEDEVAPEMDASEQAESPDDVQDGASSDEQALSPETGEIDQEKNQ